MYRFSFHRPLIAISLGLVSHSVSAALQPLAEAPLANDTELHCHFNRDASTDCTTTYRYTILKPNGREMLSRIDFDYSEGDTFEVISAQSTQPGAKPVASPTRKSIPAARPTQTRVSAATSKPPWPSPTCAWAQRSATPYATTIRQNR